MKRSANTTASRSLRIVLRRASGLLALLALLFASAGCSADEMTGGIEETPEDTTPPSVSLTNPVANAALKGEFTLQVSVSDDGQVAKVEFYADGALIGTSTAAPWTFVWNTIPPGDGPVTLQAKAYDTANNQGVSQTVTVTIKNGLELRFTNTTPTSVTIAPDGQQQRTVDSGRSTTFVYDSNPGAVSYRANAKGKHGLLLFWNEEVSTSGGVSRSVSISVGSGFFFLRGRNNSDRETSSLYVNYQASQEQKVDPFTLGDSMTGIGYFKGSGATRIRIYAKYRFPDLGPVYWDFASDINNRVASFSLGNTAAAKQPAGEEGTRLEVQFEPIDAPVQPEGTVHYPNHAEEIGG